LTGPLGVLRFLVPGGCSLAGGAAGAPGVSVVVPPPPVPMPMASSALRMSLDFLSGEPLALLGHAVLIVLGEGEAGGGFLTDRLAGGQGLAARCQGGEVVEPQLALLLRGTVALVATALEDGHDLRGQVAGRRG